MGALDAPRFNVRRVHYVKTLHTAYRVTDLVASLDFYFALGYEEVGRISIDDADTPQRADLVTLLRRALGQTERA